MPQFAVNSLVCLNIEDPDMPTIGTVGRVIGGCPAFMFTDSVLVCFDDPEFPVTCECDPEWLIAA